MKTSICTAFHVEILVEDKTASSEKGKGKVSAVPAATAASTSRLTTEEYWLVVP